VDVIFLQDNYNKPVKVTVRCESHWKVFLLSISMQVYMYRQPDIIIYSVYVI